MTCSARLNAGPLTCTRTDPHERGHVFVSSTGSWVPDHHDATSGGEH